MKASTATIRVSPEKLASFCVEVLTKTGLQHDDAQRIADVLVTTDTWGTYSHGTAALFNYVRAIRAGGIDPSAQPEVAAEGESWALIEGHSAMGMLSCLLAMNLAIEKARHHTIAWAGVRNSSHFGAAGYYANMAAAQDMIGIAMSNADPNMVVPGARGHVIGNNPIAYAIPAGNEDPILLDVALSTVAAGKIYAAKQQGRSIPDSWLTNAEGVPVTEVGDWPASGSMQPVGGHKGYGIAVLIEALAGILTGAGMLSEVKSWLQQSTEASRLGHAFLVLKVDAIMPIEAFKQRADVVITRIRQAPRARGSDRIYVPGEIEWEKRRQALKDGIPLPDSVRAALQRGGQEMGLDTGFLQ